MARPGILYSDVARAAAKLTAAGIHPTVDGVREALGGTGSKSTIAPLLKRWKAEHQETVVVAEVGLPAPLLHAVKALHEHMQSEFVQRLERAQQAHDELLRAATSHAETLHVKHQALADAHAMQGRELEQTRAMLSQLQEAYQSQSVRLATIETESVGLQQRLADRATEVSTLNNQLTQARTQFEHYQEATHAQRTEERQSYEQRIARLEHDLAHVNHLIAGQQTTLVHQHAKIEHLTSDLSDREQALRDVQDVLTNERLMRERLADRLAEATTAKDGLTTQLGATQQQLADIRSKLAVRESESGILAGQLQRAETRANQLSDEKLAWLQERGALEQRAQAAEKQATGASGLAMT